MNTNNLAPAPYRQKPIVVTAMQYIPGVSCKALAHWMIIPHHEDDCFDDAEWVIDTPEGTTYAKPGDWIVRGIRSEFYVCKADDFAATYEAVS